MSVRSSVCLSIRPSVGDRKREKWFFRLLLKIDTWNFQGLNMLPFFILSPSFIKIRQWMWVLDRFLHFLIFMIFLTPIQDRWLKFSGIEYFNILKTFLKFFIEICLLVGVLNWFLDLHVWNLTRFCDFSV